MPKPPKRLPITQPLKWHGGKHYLAKRIIKLMPLHIHYVEPYFGDGGYPVTPAIIVAVWTGPLVKYLIDDQQVTDTIRNLLNDALGADQS